MADIIPAENITNRILVLRGERVILDTDLANLYGTSTKALNQAVKRNASRFPADFIFQLTHEERDKVVTNCDHLKNIKYSRVLPYAFTEHGTVMAATILNTQRAVDISIYVVRAFIKMRQMLWEHKEVLKKLNTLEQTVSQHDVHIRSLFNAIRQLIEPPLKPKRPMGFRLSREPEES